MNNTCGLNCKRWLSIGGIFSIGFFLFFLTFLSTETVYKISFFLIVFPSFYAIYFLDLKRVGYIESRVIFYFVFLAFFWGHSFESVADFSGGGDDLLRYLLGALCFFVISRLGLNIRLVFYGIALGCFYVFFIALEQYIKFGRAEGYTNAIRFGNLCLLMGLFSIIYCFFSSIDKKTKIFFIVAFFMALGASFLSLSRGGWLLIFFIPFFIFFLNGEFNVKKVSYFLASIFFVVITSAILVNKVDLIGNRVESAVKEVKLYLENPNAHAGSSVGARLEMWQLALKMGLDSPIYGWGKRGSDTKRSEYIQDGHASPLIERFSHAHNQYLEIWASRGGIGIAGLTFLYLYPIFIFQKMRKNMNHLNSEDKRNYQILIWCGILFVFSHFIYGITDYFINMSLGHNVFAFSLVFLFGSASYIANKNKLSFA